MITDQILLKGIKKFQKFIHLRNRENIFTYKFSDFNRIFGSKFENFRSYWTNFRLKGEYLSGN